jgi:parvulin-like peptidyl-prolyl isomerase
MRLHIGALAALAGAAWMAAAVGGARAQAEPKAVVAAVNGQSITLGEVDAVIKARGPLPVEISADTRKRLQFDVVCMLIDGRLWDEYLQKNGPKIDKAEIDKRVAELEAEVKKNKKTMADYYKDSGQSETSLRSGIQAALQWEEIAKSKITDADVRRYYDENKDYFDEVLVRASHVVLKVTKNAPEADKKAAREKLQAIRANVVAGKIGFAEAAKRYSQDQTAKDGGDLGTFPRKMVMAESIAKVAFSLPVNGISDVVETEYGLHLIKVTERKPGEKPSEFGKIKDAVRDLCSAELQLAVMQDLRQAAKIEINLPK